MTADVNAGSGCVADLIVDIVSSRQFRYRRGLSFEAAGDSDKVTSHDNR